MSKSVIFWLLLGAIAGAVIVYVAIGLGKGPSEAEPPVGGGEDEEGVFCTLDAKLCPDGSYVGRVAPSCDFAPCPGN